MLTHEKAVKEICPYSFVDSNDLVHCIGNECPKWKHEFVYPDPRFPDTMYHCHKEKECMEEHGEDKIGTLECLECEEHFGRCGD